MKTPPTPTQIRDVVEALKYISDKQYQRCNNVVMGLFNMRLDDLAKEVEADNKRINYNICIFLASCLTYALEIEHEQLENRNKTN